MNPHHEHQGAQDGHDAGKQLGKAHEQTICEGVHIRNHPADKIALGVLVNIGNRQHLDVPEGFIADIPGHLEGHPVAQLTHHPLTQAADGGTENHAPEENPHLVKIYLSCVHNAVNGAAHQDGDIQRHAHIHRGQNNGRNQSRPVPANPDQDLLQRIPLTKHSGAPPWGTGNSRFPDKPGRFPAADRGYHGPPARHRPAPESHRQTGRRPPAGIPGRL